MQKSISWAVRAAMMAGVLGLMAGCSNVTKEQLAAVEAKASDAAAKAGTAASQAAEALKLVANAGTSLAGRLLLLDALSMEWRSMRLKRDPACAVCAQR